MKCILLLALILVEKYQISIYNYMHDSSRRYDRGTDMMTYLEGQKCLTEIQGSYRKNFSSITMTRKIVDHILKNKGDRIPTVSVFMDLSKAFDIICHKDLKQNYKSMELEIMC